MSNKWFIFSNRHCEQYPTASGPTTNNRLAEIPRFCSPCDEKLNIFNSDEAHISETHTIPTQYLTHNIPVWFACSLVALPRAFDGMSGRQRSLSNLIPISCVDTSSIQCVTPVQSRIVHLSISLPSLFLSNTRSLINKIEDLEVVINENNADIVCITETWLTGSIPDSVVEIKGFALVRKDRQGDRRGGGVCPYIKSSIGFSTIDELSNSPFETLWLYLRPNRLPRGFSCLIFGVNYHPPLEDDIKFTEHLISSLDFALIKYHKAGIMLICDFNRLNYRHICNHFNLRQIVKNPKCGGAILDLVFTNLSHNYNNPEILPGIGLSDHNYLIIRPSVVVQKVKAESI